MNLEGSSQINFGKIKDLYFILNRPPIKESIKKTIGIVNLIFFAWETYDLISRLKEGTLWSEKNTYPMRLIVLAARISIIGIGLSTTPGYQLVGFAASCLLGEERILQWFGPHYNFEMTPFHLRHIVSIASFILGIPALLHFLYTTIRCKNHQIRQEDRRVYLMNAFTIAASRVTLHVGNAIAKRMLMP
ncbi:MAG: hypothetical protein WB791_06015 [Waddliaceae bacterium]